MVKLSCGKESKNLLIAVVFVVHFIFPLCRATGAPVLWGLGLGQPAEPEDAVYPTT